MKTATLEIRLKSDLCAGSGYSYAGIVDSDISYDYNGFPYIPARRIKGCLRECAKLIGEDESIFGEWGQNNIEEKTKVIIGDAYIEGYKSLVDSLNMLKKDEVRELLNKDNILDEFTTIKAQTKVDSDTGTAKENSLRFTRVVNQYDPRKPGKKELVFNAKVEVCDNDALRIIERSAKALRHIGMDRNRGLGNIRCKITDNTTELKELNSIIDAIPESGNVTVRYKIRNNNPLMISTDTDDKSEHYINGTSVHGFFANEYLKKNRFNADESFERIFLKNGVIFTPLYPTDEKGRLYYPAPSWIGKLKKTKELVNLSILSRNAGENKTNIEPGNQPQKLRGKFVSENGEGYHISEVETEIIYHHRRKVEEGDQQQLYFNEAISKNQLFIGEIIGEASDVRRMIELIMKATPRFGKSRTAQYGECELQDIRIADGYENNVFYLGDEIMITLLSDAIFIDADGNYTVDTANVRRLLQEDMGIKAGESDELYTEIEVGEQTGHYGVWNLKKQAIPCVKAGSSFEFKLSEDINISKELYVGEKCGEGYGRISISPTERKWKLQECKSNNSCDISGDGAMTDDIKILYKKICMKYLMNKMKENAFIHAKEFLRNSSPKDRSIKEITASNIGKLTLMLNESVSESESITEVYTILSARINKATSSNNNKATSSNKDTKDFCDVSEAFCDRFYRDAYENIRSDIKRLDVELEEEDIEMLKITSMRQALVALKYAMKER